MLNTGNKNPKIWGKLIPKRKRESLCMYTQRICYQGQVIGRKLAELIGEISIERVEIFHGHSEVFGIVNETLSGEKKRTFCSSNDEMRKGKRGEEVRLPTGKGSRHCGRRSRG